VSGLETAEAMETTGRLRACGQVPCSTASAGFCR